MGETHSTPFSFDFNRSIRIETCEERLSEDAGVLLLREVYSLLDLDSVFDATLEDPRQEGRIIHPFSELLRTRILFDAASYQDQSDAQSLRDDPVFRLAVSDRRGCGPIETPSEGARVPGGLSSQPTLSRFENALTPQRDALGEALVTSAGRSIQLDNGGHRLRYATVDIDSFPIEVHGHQPGSTYNGYYGFNCYHPLVASVGETGHLLALKLREGNAHTAAGGMDFLLPLLDQVEEEVCQVASVRMDAGFPEEDLLALLEEREVGYVARIRTNSRLQTLAEDIPTECYEEPSLEFHELTYGARDWSCERRVVLVRDYEPGELFPREFFLLTNWSPEEMSADSLLELYRRRGNAEKHLGELKSVLLPALSSSRRAKSHYRGAPVKSPSPPVDPFAMNEVKLLLLGLAYNLLHAVRRLTERPDSAGWSLKRTQERVVKIAGNLKKGARRATFVITRTAAGAWQKAFQTLIRWRGYRERLAWA